jgi:hypothetical protein
VEFGKNPTELLRSGMGSVQDMVEYEAWWLSLLFAYVWLLHPGVYGAEPMFGIEKLGAVCPNLLAIVYCGIPPIGALLSMVVRV